MLAMRLGRTVAELKSAMSMAEFHDWAWFHAQYPIDDFHVHYRPAALIAHSMAGGSMEDKLKWLQPPPAPELPQEFAGRELNQADLSVLQTFGLL